MMAAKARYQAERRDPMMVAVWYAVAILAYPIRVALCTALPLPGGRTLRVIRSLARFFSAIVLLALAAILALILVLLGFAALDIGWPAAAESIDVNLGPFFIGVLTAMFSALIVTTGLHGYLKNFPSADTDD